MTGNKHPRCAILKIDTRYLAKLLQLPPQAKITAAACPHDQQEIVHLRIEGAGWETPPGHLIRVCTGVVTTAPTMQITWPFSDQGGAA